MSKEKYTYPCELRPLTAHDIRHLNHLNKRTFNQEGADFEVNVYPFMMEAITELLVEGTELFCISNTPDSDPVLFIERESNINGATLNYEEGTIELPVPLESFIDDPEATYRNGIFVLGKALKLEVGTYGDKLRLSGYCFLRSTREYKPGDFPVWIYGNISSCYIDGNFQTSGRIKKWHQFALKSNLSVGRTESLFAGDGKIEHVSVEGSLSTFGNLNLWRYALKGDIIISVRYSHQGNPYRKTNLFGADSCIVPVGEDPKKYMEETFGHTKGGTTPYSTYSTERMAHNMEANIEEISHYCRDSLNHDTTCMCLGWELARINKPKLYKKYVAMHERKRKNAMIEDWQALVAKHKVHDFYTY